MKHQDKALLQALGVGPLELGEIEAGADARDEALLRGLGALPPADPAPTNPDPQEDHQ